MRAYLNNDLEEYITTRFDSKAPVRMAIVPFSTPANLSWTSGENQGLGRELAWRIHSEFLTNSTLPIVEVFNREDWPGKKEEFFGGNFGAIAQAREAGYDFIMVGLVEPMKGMGTLTMHSKIIDADAGITVWYGTTNVKSEKSKIDKSPLYRFGPEIRPDLLYFDEMVSMAASCTVDKITQIEYVKTPPAMTPQRAQFGK